MKTQSEQELKPVEILDKRDGTVLVLLHKNIKNPATKKLKQSWLNQKTGKLMRSKSK